MARTLVSLHSALIPPGAIASLRRLVLAVVGTTAVAFGALGITSTKAIAATGSCAIQAESPHTPNPDLGELQRLISGGEKAPPPGSKEALPEEEAVVSEVKNEFGAQYGGSWYEVEAGDLAIGLVDGQITVQEATERLRQVLTRQFNDPQNLAFVEAHITVLSVPYAPDELAAAADAIRRELEVAGVNKGTSVGQTVGEFAGPLSPGYWPQVHVTFFGNVTEAECEKAVPILVKYGSEVSYSRMEGVPVAAIGEEPLVKPPLNGGKEPPIKGNEPKLLLKQVGKATVNPTTGVITFAIAFPTPGKAHMTSITGNARASGTSRDSESMRYGTTAREIDLAGVKQIKIRPDAMALRELRDGHTLHVVSKLTFATASTAQPLTKTIYSRVRLHIEPDRKRISHS
jgi:hypothetical protein